MKDIYLSAFILIGSILLLSCKMSPCGTKSTFITKHEKFVSKTVDQSDELSEEEWEKKDEIFKKLVEECYTEHKAEFTDSEKRVFWERNAQYYVKRVSKNKDLANLGVELKEFLDNDLKVSLGELETEIKDIFDDEFKNDLRESMEILRDGLKEMGEELKEIFKEEGNR